MDRLLSVVLESPTPETRKASKYSDIRVTVEIPGEIEYNEKTESIFAAMAEADPHKYGRLDGLKKLICDGYEAEAENRLLDALHVYKSALSMLPGEERLHRKLKNLELKLEKQGWRDGKDLTPPLKVKPEEACWDRRSVLLEREVLSPERFTAMDAVDDDDGELLFTTVKGEAEEAMASSLKAQKKESCHALIDSKCVPQLKTCNTTTSSSAWREMPLNSNEGEENLYDMGCEDMEVGLDSDLKKGMKGRSSFENFSSENCTAAQSDQKDQKHKLDRLNGDIGRALEYEILLVLNTADKDNLMMLRGIGPRRAELIINAREESHFKGLQDLKRIGMYSLQIIRIAKENTLEFLDSSFIQ